MATDWASDVKVHAPDADDGIIAGVVRYCGIALQKRDSSLVSFSDPKELDRVRNNFLKKKLALTHSDDVLNAAIAKVGERMKGDRTKNRVTVYYLLAESYGLLGLFQKKSAAPKAASAKEAKAAKAKPKTSAPKKVGGGAAVAGVASLASLGKATKTKAAVVVDGGKDALADVAGMAVAASAAAVGASGAAAAAVGEAAGKAVDAAADAVGGVVASAAEAAVAAGGKLSGAASGAVHGLIGDDAAEGSGSKRWLAWLLLLAILAFVLWWIFLSNAATG